MQCHRCESECLLDRDQDLQGRVVRFYFCPECGWEEGDELEEQVPEGQMSQQDSVLYREITLADMKPGLPEF
jgi:hypothetical protein